MGKDKNKRSWRDFSIVQKIGIILAGIVQFALLAWALVDLVRRPAVGVRWGKWIWLPIIFINFFGPITYFLLGRKRLPRAPAR
jgi:Phospholipase_D-nuclease N-terminal